MYTTYILFLDIKSNNITCYPSNITTTILYNIIPAY